MKNYVTIDYEKGQEALAWAKEHCSTYITNCTHVVKTNGYFDKEYDYGKLDFYFGKSSRGQQEMLLFLLRWA